jgi:hypothetical protein
MIESVVQARVSSDRVWQAWKKKHDLDAKKGRKGRFAYKILAVSEGESFSILWKSMFAKLIFTQEVKAIQPKKSEIRYRVEICGLFRWPLRYFLRKKIEKNLTLVLQSLVKELES